MAFNGAGVFQRLYDFITDRDSDIKIRADRMDAELYGIADGLSNTICKDGQTVISSNIPFNGKKITNLGNATQDTDALNRITADGRFQKSPSLLTPETVIADGDSFGFYDLSALADRGATYASLKTALTTDFRADGRMFPVGTRMVFQQTTPPTGWTKETGSAYDDASLKVVTGAVATSGSTAYSSVFTSRTFTGTVGGTTLTVSQLPAHTHTDTKKYLQAIVGSGGFLTNLLEDSGSATPPTGDQANPTTSSSQGSGATHTHTLTMNAADFAVKTVAMTIGVKA